MDAKRVFIHLIRAGRDALHIEKTLNEIGYKGTPYYNLHGEIADAVYEMLGEETDTFDQSETYAAMNDIYTTDEICAERLAEIYETQSEQKVPAVSEYIREMIEEAATERGTDYDTMVNVILSEWVLGRMRFAGMKTR